jgi:hypothetical protein
MRVHESCYSHHTACPGNRRQTEFSRVPTLLNIRSKPHHPCGVGADVLDALRAVGTIDGNHRMIRCLRHLAAIFAVFACALVSVAAVALPANAASVNSPQADLVRTGTTSAASTASHTAKAATVRPNYTYETLILPTLDHALLRDCPYLSCGASAFAFDYQVLADYCYTVGDMVNFNPLWDLVLNESNGQYGYIPEVYLQSQGQDTPC